MSSTIGKSPRGRLSIPANLTPEARVCWCLIWPDDPEHLAVLWGFLELLTKRYTWGEPLTDESQVLANFYSQIVGENRSHYEAVRTMPSNGCGCDDPIMRRINAITGHLEFSFDGINWEEDPADQRFTGTIVPPPPTPPGDLTKCNTAESARIALRTISDQILADGDVWVAVEGLVAAVCGILTTIFNAPGAGACAVIAALVLAVTQIGRAAISAALTQAVWDRFMCNLYCNNNPDGSFNEAGWQAVMAQISEDEDGAAELWLRWIVGSIGPVGLTNAAWALHTAVGDCEDCNCVPCDIDRVFLYNFELAEWQLQTRETETTVVLTSTQTQDFNRPAVRVAFNNAYPDGNCCNINAWEQISGNQIFIVETVNCADEVGSAALPPTGCWKMQTIFGNVNDETPQVWRLTLGADCE